MMMKCLGSAAVWQKNCILGGKSDNSNAQKLQTGDRNIHHFTIKSKGKGLWKLVTYFQLGVWWNLADWVLLIQIAGPLFNTILVVYLWSIYILLSVFSLKIPNGHGSLKEASVNSWNHCKVPAKARKWEYADLKTFAKSIIQVTTVHRIQNRQSCNKSKSLEAPEKKIMTNPEKWKRTSKPWLIQIIFMYF